MPQETAPPGYEQIRGPLWSDFTAWRTIPEWEDFEADMNEMRAILWPVIDGHVVLDATGKLAALMGAASHLQQAWEIASAAQ